MKYCFYICSHTLIRALSQQQHNKESYLDVLGLLCHSLSKENIFKKLFNLSRIQGTDQFKIKATYIFRVPLYSVLNCNFNKIVTNSLTSFYKCEKYIACMNFFFIFEYYNLELIGLTNRSSIIPLISLLFCLCLNWQ